MKCFIVEDLLPEYLEDLCSPETKQAIEEHVLICKNCRKKLDEMKENNDPKNKGGATRPEDIQPFKKIRKELKKNRIKKSVAILLLIVVCGVFGVLTIGQFFPSLDCPSYDSLMYRFRARQIAQKLADGDIKEILKGCSTNIDLSNLGGDTHSSFFYDVSDRLTELHEKIFKGRDVSIHVDSVSYYDRYFVPYDDSDDVYGPEPCYHVRLTLDVGEGKVFMLIRFDNKYSYLPDIWTGEMSSAEYVVDKATDENSLEYNIQAFGRYLEYYRCCCTGMVVEDYMTSLRVSCQNSETITKECCTSGFLSYYLTDDCTKLGIINEDTGCTDYSEKTGSGFYEIIKRCQSNNFRITKNDYNEAEKKYDATLYWKVTDLNGRECIMHKAFYYGPTGLQPVDDTETICPEDGFDSEITDNMKTMFD